MRISLYIPKDRKGIPDMLAKEIDAAENVQDKKYGQQLIKGLRKMAVNWSEEHVMFWDTEEEEFAIFPYKGKDFIYKVQKDFVTEPLDKLTKKSRYILVTMDANECTIGELNGKQIRVVWQKQSYVPRKHDAGGQSQKRFEENRRLSLLAWKKEIGEVLKRIYNTGGG